MFTLDQIKTAHSKVKSGADFPAYIREIKQLGVGFYTTYVTDGHTEFNGGDEVLVSPVKYDALTISPSVNAVQFKSDLTAHQQGKSDYMEFCNQCAANGIEKWEVCLEEMTCTYVDLEGNAILVEAIPGA